MDNNYGERKVLLSIKVSTLVVLFVVATVLLVTAAILGNISKDNTFVKLFITRWHSYEKIKRSENDSILNDKNLNFIFSNKRGNNIKSCLIIFSLFAILITFSLLLNSKKNELFSCENIDIGLNGTHILYKDNIKSQCHIKKRLVVRKCFSL